MTQVRLCVGVTTTVEDDDFILERLTAELADELRAVGEVEYVPLPARPGDKGVAEVVAAALSVFMVADSAHLRLLVDGVVAFINRNAGRRVRLKVGSTELTIDRPTHSEVETIIETIQRTIEHEQS